jgi:hypothetical protein
MFKNWLKEDLARHTETFDHSNMTWEQFVIAMFEEVLSKTKQPKTEDALKPLTV